MVFQPHTNRMLFDLGAGEGVLIFSNAVLKFSAYSCFTSIVKFTPVLFFVCLFRAIVNELHFQMDYCCYKEMQLFYVYISVFHNVSTMSTNSCLHVSVFLRNVYLWDHNLCAHMQVFFFLKLFSPFLKLILIFNAL